MQIEISDDQIEIVEEKQWFNINEKKQHQITFDVYDKYIFDDFKNFIKNDKTFHIIVPLFPECYEQYRDIIKGQNTQNIVYINDIIKPQPQEQYNEDLGLKILKNIKENDVVIHIIYLGDSFINSYFNKKRQNLMKNEEIDKKELKSQLEQLEKEKKQMQEIQKNYYDNYYQQSHYMTEFINYDFGTKQNDYNMNNFQYFASDIVKIIYTMMDKKVQIKQYDMPGRYFIKHLQENLGFFA